jgi:hypothetical protein
MRQLTLSLLCLLSLSACGLQPATQIAPSMLSSQAFLPHDPTYPNNPTPYPCQMPHFGSEAFLPHDPSDPMPTPSANPCPCHHGAIPDGLQAQAALPPDVSPSYPWHCP